MLSLRRNILIILAAGLGSCSKIIPYSTAPQISHLQLTYSAELQAPDPIFTQSPRDTIKMARLTFTLVDGDGDIGRADSTQTDSLSPGIHLWLYLPQQGQLSPAKDSTIRYLFYQMPEVDQYSSNEQVKAEVKLEINSYRSIIFPYDTIAYRYYVVDRSGKRSNILFTEQAILSR